jgi:hypothetical protein
VLHRLLLGERRVGLGDLRLENADLLLGGGDNRGVVLQRGVLFANVGLRLLGPLHGAPAVLGQLGVALKILLRIDERRLIRSDLLAVLLDHELLLGDLLVQACRCSPAPRRHWRAPDRARSGNRAGRCARAPGRP